MPVEKDIFRFDIIVDHSGSMATLQRLQQPD